MKFAKQMNFTSCKRKKPDQTTAVKTSYRADQILAVVSAEPMPFHNDQCQQGHEYGIVTLLEIAANALGSAHKQRMVAATQTVTALQLDQVAARLSAVATAACIGVLT